MPITGALPRGPIAAHVTACKKSNRAPFIVSSSRDANVIAHEDHDRYRRVVSADQRCGQYAGADRGLVGPIWSRSADHQSSRLPQRRLPDLPGNSPVDSSLPQTATQHSCLLAAGPAHRDRRAARPLRATLLSTPWHAIYHLLSHAVPAVSARALPAAAERLLSGAALVPWRGGALHGEHRLGAQRSRNPWVQEPRGLAPRRRHRDIQASPERFSRPAAPDRRLCRPNRRRKEYRGIPENGLGRHQDRDRRRPRTTAAREAVSGRGISGLSIRRGSRDAPGGGRRHGVSEPDRHLRPRQSRGHGLRRAGRRLSGHRSDRRRRGRGDRRIGSRSRRGGARVHSMWTPRSAGSAP